MTRSITTPHGRYVANDDSRWRTGFAARLITEIMNAAGDSERSGAFPDQMYLFGEKVFWLRGKQVVISRESWDLARGVHRLEILAQRMRHLSLELQGNLDLRKVATP